MAYRIVSKEGMILVTKKTLLTPSIFLSMPRHMKSSKGHRDYFFFIKKHGVFFFFSDICYRVISCLFYTPIGIESPLTPGTTPHVNAGKVM